MPRIRTIKPEFWTSEGLCSISIEAHMLAAALLNQADDEGYLNANPKLLKGAIFPLRELSSTIPVLLRELSSVGFLGLYDGTDGRVYAHVVKFLEHQVINKPKPSKIKHLIGDTVAVPDEYGIDTVAVPGERKGKEGKGKEGKGKDTAALALFLKVTGRKFTTLPDSAAARWKEGATLDDLERVLRWLWADRAGTDLEKFIRPSTVFAKSKWSEYVVEATRKPTQAAGPKCRKPVKTGKTVDFGSGPVDEESACALQSEHAGDCDHERRDDA